MSKEHRKSLFEAHSTDLSSVIPGVKDTFVCPICFAVFSPESIEENLVDVGHVWPKYFRERSDVAKHQQVLLCKKCNSSAGTAGDEIMQADAEIYEGKKTGRLGLRNISVKRTASFDKGVELEAYILKTGEKSAKLSFPKYKKRSQQRYFGEKRKKIC